MPQKRHPSTHDYRCGICGKTFGRFEVVAAEVVRPQITRLLDEQQPEWRQTGYVCRACMAGARRSYVEDLLRRERGELTELDEYVVRALEKHELLAANVDAAFDENLSFGDALADRVASFGGSWTFILGFTGVVLLWVAFNAVALFATDRFDPYPFILLNLVLSCIAAIQAPLIMMSQRRQESKDRLRAQNDYRVNLKAELEIRQLHEKLDHLLMRQWERLTEIQEIQIEQLDDLRRDKPR